MAEDYEAALLKRLRAIREGAVPAEVTPGPTDDYEAALRGRLRSFAVTHDLITPTKENPRGEVLPTSDWNVGTSILNGMTQGLLPQIAGDIGARAADPSQKFTPFGIGLKPASALPGYAGEVEKLKKAKEAYEKENGGKALLGELGGSLATAIPAMAAGAGALAPLGARIASVGPWASGIVDFLSGASKVPQLKAASQAVRGLTEGTGAAALSSGLSDVPLPEQLATGGLIGMAAGPAGGLIAGKYGSNVNKTTAESAQALVKQGIKVAAGDIPGANVVQRGMQKIFGNGAAPREQFTEALSKHAGYPTKEINQEWVNTSKKAEGKVMEDIQSVYKIPAKDSDLVLDLDSARLRALDKFSDPADIKKINTFFDKLDMHAAKGIEGPIYKNIVEKDGLIGNFVTGDQFKKVAGDVRDIFDDAWGRHLPTDKKAAWDEARGRYRVIDTIDNSMGASGAAEGVYNPKKLLAAVERKYGNVENAGDLGMLARGGQFLEPPSAAPASKHRLMKTAAPYAVAAAAMTDAATGGHIMNHIGPEFVGKLMQHPEVYTPALTALGILGLGAKGVNNMVNSPRATQYLLDVSQGSRQPMLRGTNPLIPLLVEGYNQR